MADTIPITLVDGVDVYDQIWQVLASYRKIAHKQPSALRITVDCEARLLAEVKTGNVGPDLVGEITTKGRKALPVLFGVPTQWDADRLEFVP